MRLIFEKYDPQFDPVVTGVGVVFVLGGVYGMGLLPRALRHPILLIVAALPALAAVMGVVIIIREVKLFRDRNKG